MHRGSRLSSLVAPSALALCLWTAEAAPARERPRPILLDPAGRALEVVAIDPRAPRTLYALSHQRLEGRPVRGELYKSEDGGASWLPASRGFDSPWGGARSVVADPDRPGVLFAISLDGVLYRSGDGGGLWEKITETGERDPGLALVPGRSPLLFVAGSGGRLLRSSDLGESFEAVFESSLGAGKLVSDPANPGRLYLESASAPSGLLVSEDGGESWGLLLPTLALGRFHLLGVAATRPTTLWAGNESGLFRSRDGGISWETTGLPWMAGDLALAVDPGAPAVVYAAPDRGRQGIFVSYDGGATWRTGGERLPGRQVRGLWVDRVTGNVFAESGGLVFEAREGAAKWSVGSLIGVRD